MRELFRVPRWALLVGLPLLALAAPPAADWPTHRVNAAQTGAAPGALTLPLSPRWSVDLKGAIEASPIVVGGRNFGCGSSREHAPIALGSAGCNLVLAESFARIFFRNCVATGELYPCDITDRLCEVLNTGDEVRVDLDAGTVVNKSTGDEYSIKPLGEVRPVIDAGGLFNFARENGMISK